MVPERANYFRASGKGAGNAQLGNPLHDALLSSSYARRLFRRLARVDPPRARRVAASLSDIGARSWAWAYVALGLAETDKAGASEAIEHAIQEIDRLRESAPRPDPGSFLGGVALMYSTDPAVVILPIVERIAPERLDDVFWRATALLSRVETGREDVLERSNIGCEWRCSRGMTATWRRCCFNRLE